MNGVLCIYASAYWCTCVCMCICCCMITASSWWIIIFNAFARACVAAAPRIIFLRSLSGCASTVASPAHQIDLNVKCACGPDAIRINERRQSTFVWLKWNRTYITVLYAQFYWLVVLNLCYTFRWVCGGGLYSGALNH